MDESQRSDTGLLARVQRIEELLDEDTTEEMEPVAGEERAEILARGS